MKGQAASRAGRSGRAVGNGRVAFRFNWGHIAFGLLGLGFAIYVFCFAELFGQPLAAAANPPAAAEGHPARCCSKALRSAVATDLALQFASELLSLGPRVGGGAGDDGYFSVLELLATGPPSINFAHEMRRVCPCLDGAWSEQGEWLWGLSWDNFTDDTPLGPKSFSNVLWTFDPRSTLKGQRETDRQRHIVLAAHWDSKMLPPGAAADGTVRPFLGACDSALPVAMIAVLMHMIQLRALVSAKEQLQLPKITVMFFDGEEAFVDWKGLDNTYGSRHLARRWADEGLAEEITLFILLDLLGPFGPTFRNFFPERTGNYYNVLRRIEKNLRQAGVVGGEKHLMRTNGKRNGQWGGEFFPADVGFRHGVDDDHKPWLERNVSVLHLIPVPFPTVWHTVADDASAVDTDTVHDLLLLFDEFIGRLLKGNG